MLGIFLTVESFNDLCDSIIDDIIELIKTKDIFCEKNMYCDNCCTDRQFKLVTVKISNGRLLFVYKKPKYLDGGFITYVVANDTENSYFFDI